MLHRSAATTVSLVLLAGAAHAQGKNHALRLDWDGLGDTGVEVEALVRGDFTLAARFSHAYPGADYGWLFGEAGAGTFLVGKDSRPGRFLVDFGGGPVPFDFVVEARAWVHLAVVAQGATVQVFRDGALVHTAQATRSTGGARGTLRLGRRGDGFPGEQWLGFLDDVYVIRGALDARQVQALAAPGGVPPHAASVLAGYTFEPRAVQVGRAGEARKLEVASEARTLPLPSGESRKAEVASQARTLPLPSGESRKGEVASQAFMLPLPSGESRKAEVASAARTLPVPSGDAVAVEVGLGPPRHAGPLPKLSGEARVVEVALDAPTPPLAPTHRTALRLPFLGEWVVTQGPMSAPTHWGREAFSYDFIPFEERLPGAPPRDPRVPQQWPCFGRPVLAPAAGRVVAVVNDSPDGPDKPEGDSGNMVLLEHAPGEVSELLHLAQGSVRVKVGQRVKQGAQLAACGNSGLSSSPHVHWALLRTTAPRYVSRPSVVQGTWVPAFEGGRWVRGDGVLVTGSRVQATPTGKAPLQPP